MSESKSAGAGWKAIGRASLRKGLLPTAAAALSIGAFPRPVSTEQQTLRIPEVVAPIVIDGKLSEPCYRQHPALTAFVAAGNPGLAVQATQAWVFWSKERLNFAFKVVDATPAAAKPSKKEHDVDAQDRVEVFIWSGRKEDAYYCIEVASQGALHDYRARFYRKFDDGWAAAGFQYKVTATAKGYVMEGSLSPAAMKAMGRRLKTGETFRLGLFRADFDKLGGTPTWITWQDRKGDPDFHVAESFGSARLEAVSKVSISPLQGLWAWAIQVPGLRPSL